MMAEGPAANSDDLEAMNTVVSHLELHLQQDVNRLRARVAEMGEFVARALARAAEAVLAGNSVEAQAVILRDRFLDRMDSEGERTGLELLVRHQPVGRTLRLVHASLRILSQLERIGDYAESIARQSLRIQQLDPRPELPRFAEQAALASDMLARALRAYGEEDEVLARETMTIETTADQLRDQVRDCLLERQAAGALSVSAMTMLLTVARRLERITDQTKNICEEIVFLCSGELMRHAHAENIQVLFVDDNQAALSHLAEAVGRSMDENHFAFHSAGMRPGPPDPRTRTYLESRGIDASRLVSRSLGQVASAEEQDLLIALTESAEHAFPMSSAKTLCLCWPMVDPTVFDDPAASGAAFETAWQTLEQRLRPLVEAVGRD
jgi:phosphate transport system protein